MPAELRHHLVLFLGTQLAMDHAEAQAFERAGREALELLLHGLGIVQSRFFDLRQDDVRLATLAALGPDEVVRLDRILLPEPAGADRLATRRQLIDDAE